MSIRPGNSRAMAGQDSSQEVVRGGSSRFADTQWSVVLAAKMEGSSQAAEAMEKLCRTYWKPIYCFVRRQGHSPEQAEDLTQEFFSLLLPKDYLQHLRHQNGKFRSFLLTFVKHFLSDQYDKARALKRGGGIAETRFEALSEEERYQLEPTESFSPDHLFDRRWAQTILDQASDCLRQECAANGKAALFDALQRPQTREEGAAPTHAELAVRLGMTESAFTSAVHRLRQRHFELLRKEVARTVEPGGDVDAEIRYLIEVLGRDFGPT